VNYPLEYREIGFNEKLVSVIESNGGRVYNEDEVQGLMFMDIKEKAVRTVNEPKSEKEPYLIGCAGVIPGRSDNQETERLQERQALLRRIR